MWYICTGYRYRGRWPQQAEAPLRSQVGECLLEAAREGISSAVQKSIHRADRSLVSLQLEIERQCSGHGASREQQQQQLQKLMRPRQPSSLLPYAASP